MARLPWILKLAKTATCVRNTVLQIPTNQLFEGLQWETDDEHAKQNYYSLIVERDVIKMALDHTGRIERW
jgi:hypothetical protein